MARYLKKESISSRIVAIVIEFIAYQCGELHDFNYYYIIKAKLMSLFLLKYS